MKFDISAHQPFFRFAELDSTQTYVSASIRDGEPISGCLTESQTNGRGRFQREWIAGPNSSLTTTLVFNAYKNHPEPHLIGMATAIAVANAFDAKLQWPNDIVVGGKKLAGILTEVIVGPDGDRRTIVGIGLNLGQTRFPTEIAFRATSLAIEGREVPTIDEALQRVIASIHAVPEPDAWSALRDHWERRCATQGKIFLLPGGDMALGVRVNEAACLECTVDQQTRVVSVGEALFG